MKSICSMLGLVLCGALLAAAGCVGEVSGAEGDGEGAAELTSQAYKIAPWGDSPAGNLYGLVDRGPIRICTEIAPGATMWLSVLQFNIAFAVQEWVNAVQPNSTGQLHSDVVFTCDRLWNDNVPLYDLTVVLYPGTGEGWAHGDVIDIYQDEPNFYGVLLHEFGHFFGMADTYITFAGNCEPNQPHALMCDAYAFNSLQPDDIRGARQAFRIMNPELYVGPMPITAPSSGRCIDVAAFGTANGTPVQIWDCSPGPLSNQVWTYDWDTNLYIDEHSGKCLDVAGAGTENGTPVWLWDCHGGPNQQWEPWTDGTIRSVATGKCLEVAGFAIENGGPIQIWDCHGGSNQVWK